MFGDLDDLQARARVAFDAASARTALGLAAVREYDEPSDPWEFTLADYDMYDPSDSCEDRELDEADDWAHMSDDRY